MIQIHPDAFDLVSGPTTVEQLRAAVQGAVELEHSTIPPYLTALYSMESSSSAYGIVQSIVIEEMLHMALACNLLNAIGGSPSIDGSDFVPSYPGALPMGVEDQLTVPLKPMSVELVQTVFMVIEEPDKPLEFPGGSPPAKPEGPTIGDFYGQIAQSIQELGDGIFTGEPSKQVPSGIPGLFAVTDTTSALKAIDVIVEQGEGADMGGIPTDGGDPDELAHYYRFAEIAAGKTLVSDGKGGYSYTGNEVSLGPVKPLLPNPTLADYADAPEAKAAVDAFNETYSRLLDTLHAGFNGQPGMVSSAVGDMFTLKSKFEAVTQQYVLKDGTRYVASPTFTYVPAGS